MLYFLEKHQKYIGLILLLSLLFPSLSIAQKNTYKDASLPIESRVNDLISKMTLEEKIAQLRHIHQGNFDKQGEFSLSRLKDFVKGKSYGAVEAFGYSAENYLKTIAAINLYLKHETRLGIPAIPVMEGLHGVVQDGCTIFPQSIAIAATFEPELCYQMAKIIAKEMKAIGAKQTFAPVLDLAREPRWGRVEETYGEDPFLVSEMGVSYVKGIRSEDLIATPKHFIAHGSPLGGLNLASVDGGNYALMNVYLQPFKKVFQQANPLSVMNCYSSYEGEVITGSKRFLTDLLRDELKFKGYVYSDWASVGMMNYFHKKAQNNMEAAYQAITAGIDMEASSNTYQYLQYMVENKILDEKYIDRALKNILYVKFSCGLFDEPVPVFNKKFKTKIHTKEAISLAKRIANESIILLKNDRHILPLDEKKIKSIAVIGPNANILQVGDYSWSRDDSLGNTPLNAIKKFAETKSIKINYTKGCDLVSQDSTGFNSAIEKATSSDVALVFVGSQSASFVRNSSNTTSGEGYDLSSLKLPGVQEELLRKVSTTGTPTILILVTGRPFEINWAKENLSAIITQFYGGESQGDAITDVLFGKVNPSGKLPISFPQSVGHLPVYYNYFPADKGCYNKKGSLTNPGRDYVFSTPYAAYSFGYGLSYTNFKLSNVRFNKENLHKNDTLIVTLDVENTGPKNGKEVVQLYVRDLSSAIYTRPIHELKAFKKVYVSVNKKERVTLKVPIQELAFYTPDNKWLVESGDFEIQIGTSSDNIVFKKTINVKEPGERVNPFANPPSNEIGLKQNQILGKRIIVRGIIRDVQGSRIPEVNIYVNEKKYLSDKDGEYRLEAKIGEKLIFSKKGYQPLEKTVGKDGVININLIIK